MQEVAIIGAGLSGLALALSLKKKGIESIIYEQRHDAPLNLGGAIMLSPNALRIMDSIGAWEPAKPHSYEFETLEFRDSTVSPPKLLDVQEMGGKEKYGYPAVRIYRSEVIDLFLKLVKDAGIPINYGKKFSRVVEETAEGVTWEFTDGEKLTAPLLVGADGIHSSVRSYLYPDLKAKYTGLVGVSATVPTAQLKAPADAHFPVTYTNPKHGAYVLAPQQPDGSEIFFGRVYRSPGERTRAEWDAFDKNTVPLREHLQADVQDFPEVVQNMVSNIPLDQIRTWAFHIVPKLDKWSSEKHRRVVILGDAAHAIPPSAAQGINQAFEDVYIFALLTAAARKLAAEKGPGSEPELVNSAMNYWQTYRQARVEKVLALNAQIDLRRLPQAKEGEAQVERLDLELGWLFNANFDAVVQDWIDGKTALESSERQL